MEIQVVTDVIERATPLDLEKIENALKTYMQASTNPAYRRYLLVIDTNFHLEILKVAGNKVIYDICENIFERLYLKYHPEFMQKERIKEAFLEHTSILRALKSRNRREAERLLRHHIRNGGKHIVGSLLQERETRSFPMP